MDMYIGPTIEYTVRTLPVSGIGEDPLGIAQVSGFYGPGTWSAWYFTILAAWIQLLVHPKKKLDPNSWFYILAMNWAAIDLIRQVHSLRAAQDRGDPLDVRKKFMGPMAAPYVVVYWGSLHAIVQNVVAFFAAGLIIVMEHGTTDIDDLRVWFQVLFSRRLVLSMGLILPLAALSIMCFNPPLHQDFPKEAESYQFFPALYWQGIRGEHVTSIFFSGLGGVAMLPIFALYTILILLANAQGCFRLVVAFLQPRIARIRSFLAPIGSLLDSLLPLPLMALWSRKLLSLCGPPLVGLMICFSFVLIVYGLAMLLSIFCFFIIPTATIHYFFYIAWGTKMSESCFLMPCAPQSIYDWDQAFSLTAGLVLLIFTEIVPSAGKITRILERLQERKGSFLECSLEDLNIVASEQMEMESMEAGLGSGSNQESDRT